MALNLVLYAGDELGPLKIENELTLSGKENMATAGFTTVVIGMFHIGDPEVAFDTQLGDIIFNGGNPILIRNGSFFYSGAQTWVSQLLRLKTSVGSTITKVYASFGGGSPVQDFATIKKIYEQNGNSFEGTMLKKNLGLFTELFSGHRAFDGIDMDCEETYDVPSFVAFCEMLNKMGFPITFCPYTNQPFWDEAQKKIQAASPGAVKWWNLQCYDGGAPNIPQEWAKGLPAGFIIPGDWVRFWDPCAQSFNGDCPTTMTSRFNGFLGPIPLGGGFVYNLDMIRDTEHNSGDNGCGQKDRIKPIDYRTAVQAGLGG